MVNSPFYDVISIYELVKSITDGQVESLIIDKQIFL